MSLYASIRKQGARAAAAVRLAFRALLTGLDTSPGVQLGQCHGLAGETLQAHEVLQEYGFTSAPPDGTQCVVLPLGGKTSHGVIVATEHAAYRIQGLARGEVAIYTLDDKDVAGCRIVLKRGNRIEIQARTIDIRAEGLLHLSGREVEIHADQRLETDIAGYGDATNHVGGTTWKMDTYHTGAAFEPTVEHGIQPPEVD